MAPKTDGAEVRTIEPGIVTRIAQGVRYAITGQRPINWFGPLQPITPAAPEDVAGRLFDYPVGYNLRMRPREGEPITFEQMRGLSDACDLLRLVIETRKDQLVKLGWGIKQKDKKKKNPNEAGIKTLTDFYQSPDKEHTWQQWLRMIVEDMLVIDATTLYPRKTKGGELYALEPMAGETIKRVIDYSGRTPHPPEPAYQQILKGLPAVDYTTDELIYYPRNIRTNKIYGQSPVEQIIMTVNIILRRELSQLNYYTEGNIPDAFGHVPAEWNPDQISQFQAYWDALIEGDTAQKRKMKWIPGGSGTNITFAKDIKLKDEYDEWLARVICYCFNLPPTAFIKQINRATAQTAQETALQEGLIPLMTWVSDLINFTITKFHGITDLEFTWKEEKDIDPQIQAQIDEIHLRTGIKSVDEVRESLGMEPIDINKATNMVYTGSGPVLLIDILVPPEPVPAVAPPLAGAEPVAPGAVPALPPDKVPQGTEPGAQGALKLEKGKKKVINPPNPERKVVKQARAKLKKTLIGHFGAFAEQTAKDLGPAIKAVQKVDRDVIDRILDEIDFQGWSVLIDPVAESLETVFRDAGLDALKKMEIRDKGITDLVNEDSLAFARERAAEMVGMKFTDSGKLVENPTARWVISEDTREMLRGQVQKAIEEGWSTKHLADELKGSHAFSDSRADMISRTELKKADNMGNIAGYRASGIPLDKEWQMSSDHPESDDCDDNESDGWIDLDEAFSSGDDSPPNHPNCECSLGIRLKE